MHGDAKSVEELRAAVRVGVGRIVVDSCIEIAYLAGLAARRQRVLIRVAAERELYGHSLAETVARVLAQPNLDLIGLSCHAGSQVTDPGCYGAASHRTVTAMANIRANHGVILTELNLGGAKAFHMFTVIASSISTSWPTSSTRHWTLPVPPSVSPARSWWCNRPGHQRARRYHAVSGVLGDDTAARADFRRRGRRTKRQPADGAVSREIHRGAD
ncbi:pyridoxal-dependent decarboxylase, pyridoxal binding domain protein [Mycobacterium xenopi 4042]|uniref:Pyridoxal-dependent decarboxylase, pyridoxal binding domain protein n=1 Tax=Mycobacterium xenopi 4042 TaxID=1299334 RepID=X8AGH1_MYCXE|nr:pyridoxal-dependent decarboxylase, pyridoxal binding domain protein [Mycobacterium xenopi 4042]